MKTITRFLMLFLVIALLMPTLTASAQSLDARDITLNKHNMKTGWTKGTSIETASYTSRDFMKDDLYVKARAIVFSSAAEAQEVWEEEVIEGYIIEGNRPAPTIAVDAYGESGVDYGEYLIRKGNVITAVWFDFDGAWNYSNSLLACEKVQVRRIANPGLTAWCNVVPD